jgi:hypothetical protein
VVSFVARPDPHPVMAVHGAHQNMGTQINPTDYRIVNLGE